MAKRKTPTASGSQPPSAASTVTDATLVVLGVALITTAVANAAANLSKIGLPIPAPGALVARIVFGVLGLALLVTGLASHWGPSLHGAITALRSWQRRSTAPRPPGVNVGIPPDRHPHFTDRNVELEQLRLRLVSQRRTDLIGLGGVGKSQLAVEYLHRQRPEYPDGCFWLRGESAATLSADLAALVGLLPGLHLEEEQLSEQELVIAAVTVWLRNHEGWLLVIDNLDETVIPALDELLARGLGGHVLVSCRVPVWSNPLPVEPLSVEVATSFLLERTGRADAQAAGAIAEALGGLPLALEQAAAYMLASGRDLSSYARLLHTRLRELSREGRPKDYPLTVATTWKLSFDRIEQESAPAAALLRLCVFLAPDDIPVRLLQTDAGELPSKLNATMKDEIRLDGAIGVLRRYSLVDRLGDGLRVHRLVQSVVRESLPSDEGRLWLGAAVRLLSSAFPGQVDDPSTWPLCARLLPTRRPPWHCSENRSWSRMRRAGCWTESQAI